MRSVGSLDLSMYPRAIVLLARNPQILLGPLIASVAEVLIFKLFAADGGAFGIVGQIVLAIVVPLIAWFGLAVAVVAGEDAWRYGKAPFEDAYVASRRRATDILIAAIGYSFLIYIAGLVGGTIGPWGSIVLTAVATVFCIYMLPAAAIGGIPGGASLEISVQRVRNAPLPAIVVAAIYFLSVAYVPTLVTLSLEPLRFSGTIFASGDVSSLIVALVKAVISAYVALLLAKQYGDSSYGRPRY